MTKKVPIVNQICRIYDFWDELWNWWYCVAERRIAAIKAIRDIEIEQSLTAQRLLCSYFTEEQLETPVLDFFKENLPDVSIEVEDNGEIEFNWNHNTGDSSLGGYP